MTDSERKTLISAADAEGMETSTWARVELLALAKRRLASKD
jgi:hypothetical protein